MSVRHVLDPISDDVLSGILVEWAHVDEDATWIASCVSQRWRQVVLACPQAWARVVFNFNQSKSQEDAEWCIEEEEDVNGHRGRPRPMALWLERSGCTPLYLTIEVGRVAPTGSELADMVLLLQLYTSRIQEVTLRVDFPLVADALLDMLWQSAPALLHVEIDCPKTRLPYDERAVMKSLWGALEHARNVRSLTFVGCLPPGYLGAQPYSLRTLILQDVTSPILTVIDGLAAFQCLENLVILRFMVNRDMEAGLLPPSPIVPLSKVITLPSLRSLTLESRHSYMILPYITTPNLVTLDARNLIPFRALSNGLDSDGM